MRLYGQVTIPVPSGALIKMVERDANDLDLYAHLPEGVGVVSLRSSTQAPGTNRAHALRKRTPRAPVKIHALAHEYARVVILAPLYLRAGFTRRDEHPYTDTEIDASVTQWTGWSGKPATRLARS